MIDWLVEEKAIVSDGTVSVACASDCKWEFRSRKAAKLTKAAAIADGVSDDPL